MRKGYSDPGFVNEAKIGLNDLIRAAYRNADIVLIGDGDHSEDDLLEHFGKSKSAVTLAESGVSHMFIELSLELQYFVDRLASGAVDKEQFIKEGIEAGFDARYRDNNEVLGEIADIVERASQVGIKVHCADLGNGCDEGALANTMSRRLNEGEYPNQVTHDTVNAAYKKYFGARLDDRGLAEFINERVPEGEKAVVIYGAGHGSLYNDFEEHLREGTRVVKIDVSPSEHSYEAMQRSKVEVNDRIGIRMGEDAPDAVYIMQGLFSGGLVYTTGATSKEFSDDIEESAKWFKSAEKSDYPDIKPEENYTPQLDGVNSVTIKLL